MSIMRMDPFREFDRLSKDLLQGNFIRPNSLAMDVWKDGNEYVVEFDLPGVDPADVELDIERNVLTVSGERSSRTTEDTEVVAEERVYGTFRRQVMLSDNLNPDEAKATYDHGVLTVRIPAAEQSKARKIEIATPKDDKPEEIEG